MATVSRQPFAPLNEARLQNLTSLKNRQNAIPPSPASSKRKAELLDNDDSENVDPVIFSKRPKASKGSSLKDNDILKPKNYILKTTSTPKPVLASSTPVTTPRRATPVKALGPRFNNGVVKSSPASAPAGRSPTRGKKPGLLSNRRRSGPVTRIDPPSFSLGNATPFSLDAALKGTIPSYTARSTPSVKSTPAQSSSLKEPSMSASWFFDIHEDTPEQEMTNLLQHSTCVLDISSDEESVLRSRRETKEDKENVPPADDVSQTSSRLRERSADGEMVVEKERVALREMSAEEFYPEGCDETSVIIIPADDDEQQNENVPNENARPLSATKDFQFAPELKSLPPAPSPMEPLEESEEPLETSAEAFEALMGKKEESPRSSVLQPIDGTGESFELWESGSFKDENEAAASADAQP